MKIDDINYDDPNLSWMEYVAQVRLQLDEVGLHLRT